MLKYRNAKLARVGFLGVVLVLLGHRRGPST